MAAPKSKKVWWSILILASFVLMNAVWHNQAKRNHKVGTALDAGKSESKIIDHSQPGPDEMQSKDLPPQQVFVE